MDDKKGFYADFVCKKEFFEVPDAQFDENLTALMEGIRRKVSDARTEYEATKGFTIDVKGCELVGFGWK